MKKTLTIFILLLVIIQLNAQISEKHAIYLSGERDFGNYVGFNLNLNYVLNDNFSLKIGYAGHRRKAITQPDDFKGLAELPGVMLGTEPSFYQIYDKIGNFQILAGKIVNLNKRGSIRLNMSGGIGYTVIFEPINWTPATSTTLRDFYRYEIGKQQTVSLIVNPKVEFPLTDLLGLTISPLLQANKERTYIGIGIGWMFGWLRK